MGVPTLEVSYTSATTGRGDHEVHKGHVVALGEEKQALRVSQYSETNVMHFLFNLLRIKGL
jgi:hypothetical protein